MTGEGCAYVRPSHQDYLSDYSQLTSVGVRLHSKGGTQRGLVRPAAPCSLVGIDSFYIAPVDWRVDRRSTARDGDLRTRVSRAFDRELRDRLGEIRPVVAEPGPRTAVVRAAVTDAVIARPFVNAALTTVAVPLANGGGAFEVEVLSPDHQQVAAVSSSSSGGALEFFSYFSRSWQASDAARRAAEEVQAVLLSAEN